MQQRTTLETKKNNLENVLANDLLKSESELRRELEEISLSDKRQQLELTCTELSHLDATIVQNQERYGGKIQFWYRIHTLLIRTTMVQEPNSCCDGLQYQFHLCI